MIALARRLRTALAVAAGGLLLAGPVAAAPGELRPVRSSLPPLELREHQVDVTVYDGFAVTRVEQTFFNHLERDLEARWSFPVPRDASVAGCSIWIDGREVVGEVVELQRARAIYEEQRRAGRDAALTQREGLGRFTVRVAPVRARSSQRVRLEYYQPLELDHSVGRYVYPLAAGNTDRVRAVFEDRPAAARARIEVALRTSLPLTKVATPGWEGASVVTERDDGGRRVVLETGTNALDEDFVLYWRVDPEAPARTHLLAAPPRDGEDGAFLLHFTPGGELPEIEGGVDWSFVVDVSGSMRGAKLRTTTEAVAELVQVLRPEDRFSVVSFSSHAHTVVGGPCPARRPDVAEALESVRGLTAGGDTNVFGGLDLAARRVDAERTSAVVLLTDGVANAGRTERRAFLELVERADVRVFALEIGNEANQALLDHVARASGGTHMQVSTADLASGRMLQLRDKVRRRALTDVELTVEGAEELGLSRLAPREPGNVYAGEQLRVFGRYRRSGPARVALRARRGGEPVSWTADLQLPAEGGAPEVLRMWALARVQGLRERQALGGDGAALRAEARDLALRHGLVTEQTAMLVLSEADRERYGVGSANAERLERERRARTAGPRGQQAKAQPARSSPPVQGPGSYHHAGGGGGGGGWGGGGGAFGPLGALASAALAAAARRRRPSGRRAA